MHSNLEVTVDEEQTKNLYGKTHHVTVLDYFRMFYSRSNTPTVGPPYGCPGLLVKTINNLFLI